MYIIYYIQDVFFFKKEGCDYFICQMEKQCMHHNEPIYSFLFSSAVAVELKE